jgi:hypothetical protein
MSRFYGSLTGSARTTATKRGTPSSGVSAHVRGWNIGGKVQVLEGADGRDMVMFRLTGGSNNESSEIIAAYALNSDGTFERTS